MLSWLFRNAQAPSWLFGPRTDISAEPHLIGPVQNDFVIVFLYIVKIKKGQQNRTMCIFQQVTVPVMRKFHVQTIDNVSGQIVYVMAAVIVQIILMKKIVKVTMRLDIQEFKLFVLSRF